MVLSIRFALVAMLTGASNLASASPANILDARYKTHLWGPAINDPGVDACYSDYHDDCLTGGRDKCGTSLCEDICLSTFPQLKLCCDASEQGTLLSRNQGIDCYHAYAVWTGGGINDPVTVYPSSTMAPFSPEETPVGGGAIAAYAPGGASYTASGNVVPQSINSPATGAATATTAAAAAIATGSMSSQNNTTANTTAASSPPSKTAAAASGPTTSNGVDRLAFSHEQQVGTVGLGFVWLLSALLL